MNKEEIKDYITELESMFELSELEEHKRNILKVGIYIKQLQQENQKYKEVIDKLKKAIDECWYMDSENIGEQIFLKKCELKDILKEVE